MSSFVDSYNTRDIINFYFYSEIINLLDFVIISSSSQMMEISHPAISIENIL